MEERSSAFNDGRAIVEAQQRRLRDRPVSSDISGGRLEAFLQASEQAVLAAEAVFGYSLPPILRTVYLTVANGGFGPGYGIMGVDGGFEDDQRRGIVSRYQCFLNLDPEDSNGHATAPGSSSARGAAECIRW